MESEKAADHEKLERRIHGFGETKEDIVRGIFISAGENA